MNACRYEAVLTTKLSRRAIRSSCGLTLAVLLLAATACMDRHWPANASASTVASPQSASEAKDPSSCNSGNTIRADVIALEQVYFYNRFGAFNPAGLMYALSHDVVDNRDSDDSAKEADEKPVKLKHDAEADRAYAGHVRLRQDRRPRPLVLRMHEGDCLEVTFTNLLAPMENGQESYFDPARGAPIQEADGKAILDNKFNADPADRKNHGRDEMVIDSEEPKTRYSSMHVNGLEYIPGDKSTDSQGHQMLASDGANVGRNVSSLAAPGQTKVYRWYAKKGSEGSYLFYSMGAPAGGEGDGGQLGLGLFGSVNVEPAGSVWYRSQVTEDDLKQATTGRNKHDGPVLTYDAKHNAGPLKGEPILRILNDDNQVIYGDLNAVIDNKKKVDDDHPGEDCSHVAPAFAPSCGEPYREFTTIFHDELTAVQAYPELEDESNPISALKDNMAINYGSAGLGSMVLANRKGIGPAKDCKECKLEEFFLTSWANGDPALIVVKDAETGKGVRALYPDDPSNVHHSYLGDPVRFRTMHAGPKETHVFHLHAHQWLRDRADPNSIYLDSQTISPGASFTYDILYGGSGNRNLTPGDSIFHCHLYPHFAQGMWELWRVHDVFEDGSRALPDGELGHGTDPESGVTRGGTPIPALVPLPRVALAPMPTYSKKDGEAALPGYPFYIAAKAGHRPPQAPYDLAVGGADKGVCKTDPSNPACLDGGLPRHYVGEVPNGDDPSGGGFELGKPAVDSVYLDEGTIGGKDRDLYDRGHRLHIKNALAVSQKNSDGTLWSLALKLKEASLTLLPWEGDKGEKAAIAFHEGKQNLPKHQLVDPKQSGYEWSGKGYASCDSVGNCDDKVFLVNGLPPEPGAPFANPCPATYSDGNPDHKPLPVGSRNYKAAYLQFDMTVNRWGWHDPQARVAVLEQDVKNTLNGTRAPEPLFMRANSNECVQFSATNLIPSALNLDDFQIFSPTDTIGQHIHLVKFDVTASDGSGNGFNYEDGTLSPDEVRERIQAYNTYLARHGGMIDGQARQPLKPKVHPMFAANGAMANDPRGQCPSDPKEWDKHPWCGAQTTVQRWWTDPVQDWDRNHAPLEYLGDDRTLRTVFTHDHFGPSSHQHHGLYAALVVEPRGSEWRTITPNTDKKPSGDGTNEYGDLLGWREDGGPTSYAAHILNKPGTLNPCKDMDDCRREFNLAFADFAIVYDKNQQPVNAENRIEKDLPIGIIHGPKPLPQGISGGDPGTQLINYRNEPIPLRIAEQDKKGNWHQKADEKGDLAHVFSSKMHEKSLPELKLPPVEPLGVRKPGDPATPVLYACEGEKVQIRLIQGAQEEQHVFSMNGARWLAEPGSPNSGYMNAQQLGISEHFEFDAEFSKDPLAGRRDYLYNSAAADNLWDGQWGIIRTYNPVYSERTYEEHEYKEKRRSDRPKFNEIDYPKGNDQYKAGDYPPRLSPFAESDELDFIKRVKGDRAPKVGPQASPCPDDAPIRRLEVEARLVDLTYNKYFGMTDPNAIVFVKTKENGMAVKGDETHPLVLRAAAGECIFVKLFNRLPKVMPDDPVNPFALWRETWSHNGMPPIVENFNFNELASSNRVSLHPQLVENNVMFYDGADVGFNNDSTVPPGKFAYQYQWYAGKYNPYDRKEPDPIPIEFGASALRDMGDVIKHASHGAIGALIIEPKGATWVEDPDNSAIATVTPPAGQQPFREFVVLYQDDLSLRQAGKPMPNLRNGDDSEDSGQKAFNYRTEPLWARVGANDPAVPPDQLAQYDFKNAFSSLPTCADGSKELRCADGSQPAVSAHGEVPLCRDQKPAICADDSIPEAGHGDPETPIFTAQAGQDVRFRVVHPGGHPRQHGFTVFGHPWPSFPWTDHSHQIGVNPEQSTLVGSASGIGPMRHINIVASAGGSFHVPGDYLYRSQEGFQFQGGLWGLFRVCQPDDEKCLKTSH